MCVVEMRWRCETASLTTAINVWVLTSQTQFSMSRKEQCLTFLIKPECRRLPAWPGTPIRFVKTVFLNGSGTSPIRNHFHHYIMYWTSCNKAGAGFMQWLIQNCPRATIYNDKDGCSIANNTLNQQVFTANPTAAIHQPLTPLCTILDIFWWC